MVHEAPPGRFAPERLPPGSVAVLFEADWCGHCARFRAHFKRLREGWIVDVSDEDDPLWDTLALKVVPTVIVFQDGVPTSRRWEGRLQEGHVLEIESALAVRP